MSERPYISFAECKQVISFEEVLTALGLTDFKITSTEISGVCPLPSHEHTSPRPNPQQFKAHQRNGIWLWKCFSPECNQGGDIIEFVKLMTGYSNAHVRFWFAERWGNRLSTAKPDKRWSTNGESIEKAPSDAGQEREPERGQLSTTIVRDEPTSIKPLGCAYG